MIETIYVEEAVRQHRRSQEILARYPQARIIDIERYGQVFNKSRQHFRLQKNQPALILAEKHGNRVLPAPQAYNIGGMHNYYFSHMMNCVYDCRYCFLQGMYRSAHYVLYVNYEDFAQQIRQTIAKHPPGSTYFFSGYDCDSLAFEPVTGFAEYFVSLFTQLDAWMELRTKSTQIRQLLQQPVNPRVIVAFSLSPDIVVEKLEARTASLDKRLDALEKLAVRGWSLGLRFDPVIFSADWRELYQELFRRVFARIPSTSIHSVSLGVFRMPEDFFKRIRKLYPDEALYAMQYVSKAGQLSYAEEMEQEIMDGCREMLLQYIPEEKLFRCQEEVCQNP